MNARDRGLRTAGVITAALVATGIAGTITVAAVVSAQDTTSTSASTSTSTSTSTSSDSTQSTVDVGSSNSDQSTHAQSGGS